MPFNDNFTETPFMYLSEKQKQNMINVFLKIMLELITIYFLYKVIHYLLILF